MTYKNKFSLKTQIRSLLILLFVTTFINVHAQRQMDVEGPATTIELVEFKATSISGSRDVLQLTVPAGTTAAQGDFLECRNGTALSARIDADGSYHFADGTVQSTAATGPIAYGYIYANGNIGSGSGNFTCSWDATNNRYIISITGQNYFFDDYCTQVTLSGSFGDVYTSSVGGDLLVYTRDGTGTPGQRQFQFAVFKP